MDETNNLESLKEFFSDLVKNLRHISDPESINLIVHKRKILEGLCEQLLKKRESLKSVKKDLENIFDDPEFVDTQINNEGISLGFFPTIYDYFSDLVSNYVNDYLRIASEYECRLKVN